jgi:hypothetical protein
MSGGSIPMRTSTSMPIQQSSRPTNQLNKMKYELSHPALHKRKPGIITFKGKQIIWKSQQQPEETVTINLDQVIETKKEEKEKNNTSLLFIGTSGGKEGKYVFAFSGGIPYIRYK